MSNDYTQTLPPVPALDLYQTGYERFDMEEYGHACAESARAPLIARIAELEKELSANDIDRHAELTHRLLRRAKIITEQGTRIAELEAEIAQVSGYCETLTQRCVDDTAENGRLRAELAAKDGEVEKYRADADRLEWLSLKWGGLRGDYAAWVLRRGGTGDLSDIRSFVDAARKGEGSEG